LLYVADRKAPLPEEKNIKELVVRHFTKVTICRLDADFKKESAAWIQGRPASILVSGSFGRSTVSRLFHKSFVAEIIEDHHVPVFIAHRK
jgi:hypothetical protein